MTSTALILNLLLGGLLIAALALGIRLDRRLKALRDSQAGFIKAVAELDQAAARTQSGLQQWRDATDEARELLHDRIEKAKVQAAKLEKLLAQPVPEARAPEPARNAPNAVDRLMERMEARRAAAPAPATVELKAPVDDAEARAEALAAAVLNLSPRDELRDRRPTARHLRMEPRAPLRPRATVDDDLFDLAPAGSAAPQREPAAFLRGRR